MVTESTSTKMALCFSASLSRIKRKASEYTSGPMAESLKDTGSTGNKMESAPIRILTKTRVSRAYGNKDAVCFGSNQQ